MRFQLITPIICLLGLASCGTTDNLRFPALNKFLVNSQDTELTREIETEVTKEIDVSPRAQMRTLSIGPKTLQSLVTNSPKVLEAESQVFAAEQRVYNAIAGFDVFIDGSVQGGSKSLVDSENGVFGTLSASKLIRDNGRTDAEIKSKQIEYDLAYERYLQVIASEVTSGLSELVNFERQADYMNLAYLKSSVAQPLLENLKRLSDAGQIDTVQVLSAEQKLSNLNIDFERAKSATEIAASKVKQIFGYTPQELTFDIADIEEKTKILIGFEASESAAVELSKLEERLAVSRLDIHTRTKWGSLTARSQLDVPVGGGSAEPDASIGLVFTRVLRDSGRYENTKKELEFAVESSKSATLAAERIAEINLKEFQNIQAQLENQLSTLEEQVLNTNERKTKIENQLAIGSVSFTELLNIEQELYTLEKSIVDLQAEQLRSIISLMGLFGNQLEILGVSAPMPKTTF